MSVESWPWMSNSLIGAEILSGHQRRYSEEAEAVAMESANKSIGFLRGTIETKSIHAKSLTDSVTGVCLLREIKDKVGKWKGD
jgi:hypothetical protein